jgi:hypothetical protein
MKRNNFKQDIKEIKKVSNMIPKTINEAINFNEIDNDEIDDEFGMEDEPTEPSEDIITGETDKKIEMPNDGLDVENFINDTRKKALNIMAKLADEPESRTYDIAKRIWQICDKSIADEKIERSGDVQEKQPR